MKDQVVSWFLRNVLLPKMEDIENPGFLVLRLSGKKGETNLREIMFPEDLLAAIEKKAVETYGDAGRQAMYSTGKKFGWEYASASNFNRKGESSLHDIESLAYNLVRYIECSYASKLEHEFDVDKELFKIRMDNYVICSKDGLGYLMGSGGISGIWAYVMQNKAVDGAETKCQGRGDSMCEVVCGPPEVLKGLGIETKLKETSLTDRKLTPEYLALNKIVKTSYATKSLKEMVSSGMFEYAHGIMKFKENRYFLLESSCAYILEQELSKLEGGEDLIFQSAFDFGKSLVTRTHQNLSFITDYMSALGWGDVYVSLKDKAYRVISSHYPWSDYSKGSRFIIFRGLASGLLSGIVGKEIRLAKTESSLSSGSLDIIVS